MLIRQPFMNICREPGAGTTIPYSRILLSGPPGLTLPPFTTPRGRFPRAAKSSPSARTSGALAHATHQRNLVTVSVARCERRVWLSALDSALRATIIVTLRPLSARRIVAEPVIPVCRIARQEAGKRNHNNTVATGSRSALGLDSPAIPHSPSAVQSFHGPRGAAPDVHLGE